MPGYIHHIEWSVSDLSLASEQVGKCFGFTLFANRNIRDANGDLTIEQKVYKSGDTTFVLSKQFCAADADSFPSLYSEKKDTLFNICLEVSCVGNVLDRASKFGAEIITDLTEVESAEGRIEFAVIKSCVGNIIHTLVDTRNYHGHFLPGFEPVTLEHESEVLSTHMDHVTYVCECGQSEDVLKWYRDVFGMQRFLVNSSESVSEGVTIGKFPTSLTLGINALIIDLPFQPTMLASD